jgi:serine/threonine protein kinase
MLKAFSNHRDPHMIKLLATFRWRGRYHLIFPYARSNLRNYWEETPTPEFSQTTISWMLCQCKGIAAGLYAIHEYKNSERKQQATLGSDLPHRRANKENRFGRHGDIKPENILWSDEDIHHGLGLLLIADFGLMEFHREHSRSKVKPDNVVGSPTYAPPELELRLPISPAYDVWSLGCVFLEFATWLVMGWQGLDGFPEARAFTATDGVNNDTFFTILSGGGSKPYAIVRPGVIRWIKNLHRAPRCTPFVHEFLDLISNDMLVVEASERIKCGALNNKLADMRHKMDEDPEYLTHPTPWREEEHPTVSTDLAPSGRIFDSPPPSPNVGTALPRRITAANLHTPGKSLNWEPFLLNVNHTPPHRNRTIP